MVKKIFKPLFLCFIALATQTPVVSALSDAQRNLFILGINYFDSGAPSCSGGTPNLNSTSNTDYAGRSILKQGDLKDLADNSATYQQAASQVGIPWQALAALHYRESNFSTTEPDTKPVAVGVYQFTYNVNNRQKYNLDGPNYPAGNQKLTAEQFLAQSIDAANFVKNDGAGLGASPEVSATKGAFVKYNGEPQTYVDQATALGYTSSEGYEGSPYVMNIADPPRDPSNGPLATWLQGRGGNNFTPATADQYGAFVVFASIAGITLSGGTCGASGVNCNANATQNLGSIRQAVVCIAQAELSKWNSGSLKPGTDYKIYSEATPEDWCADFASWVFNQAGYPLKEGPTWRISGVDAVKAVGEANQRFHWHDKSGYIPKPGDLAIHNDGKTDYHVNIVVGISGNRVTLIGGNQGSNDFAQSKVSRDSLQNDIIGYVTPD